MRYQTPLLLSLFCLFSQVAIAVDSYNHLYNQSKKNLWSKVYRDGGETLYCGQKFSRSDRRGLNVEHVLPMAWVMNKFRCRDRGSCRQNPEFRQIEADMHNLFPVRMHINQRRGSMPYGIVRGEPRELGSCDFEIDHHLRLVEPRNEVRGDIARTMAYMHERYGIRIHYRQQRLLLNWNRQDPPSTHEKQRNALIEHIQGNRNKFIDEPDAVARLFR